MEDAEKKLHSLVTMLHAAHAADPANGLVNGLLATVAGHTYPRNGDGPVDIVDRVKLDWWLMAGSAQDLRHTHEAVKQVVPHDDIRLALAAVDKAPPMGQLWLIGRLKRRVIARMENL
jgi:hypothetical protein